MGKQGERTSPAKVPVDPVKKLQAVERYRAGEKLSLLATEFGVSPSAIRRWGYREDRIREAVTGVRGDGWEDVGDERPVPIREEYCLALYIGHTPDTFRDKKFAARYAKWLNKHSEAQLLARALDLGVASEKFQNNEYGKRFAPWLRAARTR